ncbi:MAG TPA: hypothetical protein VN455_14115 [Methanotrichaceae archaeon]|nr:hypothetical protein [Methanotrichaceae archaeon]
MSDLFSGEDLKPRSLDEMKKEVSDLMAESERLREEHDSMLKRSDELRNQSIEARSADPALAESLWEESEKLRDESKDVLRESVEKRVRAADVQHRVDIRAEMEVIDQSDEIWKAASRARRG